MNDRHYICELLYTEFIFLPLILTYFILYSDYTLEVLILFYKYMPSKYNIFAFLI